MCFRALPSSPQCNAEGMHQLSSRMRGRDILIKSPHLGALRVLTIATLDGTLLSEAASSFLAAQNGNNHTESILFAIFFDQ